MKNLSKEYKNYELCILRKAEVNIKNDEKDGFICIYKRQSNGKNVIISTLKYMLKII